MTNKVKPFFIRITDDMTPQMVQDAFDKCVDAGAVANDGVKTANRKHQYEKLYGVSFDFFGVDSGNNTYIAVVACAYGELAKEITLDQLDEWLGLSDVVEWKNGDECNYMNSPVKHYFVGLNPILKSHCYILSDDGCVNYVEISRLSKPETPEQKAERERKEAIDIMIEDFLSQPQRRDIESAVKRVCSTLYDAGYRKK